MVAKGGCAGWRNYCMKVFDSMAIVDIHMFPY